MQPAPAPVILFLKARIAGGAGADLFATPVQVSGYTTQDGTYVAPHRATRHKRILVQAVPPAARQAPRPVQTDLFAAPPAPPPKPRQADLFADAAPPRAKVEAPKPAPKPEPKPAPVPEPAPPKPEAKPAAAPDLLLADQATWERAIWAAAEARWNAGGNVTFATSLQGTYVTPKNRGVMRLHNGALQFAEGTRNGKPNWIRLGPSGQAIDSLAAGLGLPTSYARLSASIEARTPEQDAADAAKLADTAKALRPLLLARERARLASIAAGGAHDAETVFHEADAALRAAAKARGVTGFALDDIKAEFNPDEAELSGGGLAATEPEKPAEPSTETAEPFSWGMPPGVGKRDRKRANAAALKLLDKKTDAQMTDADRQVLARYTGTGGVGESINEFYTPVPVAAAMWAMLRNAGFAGGTVLEPSSGTGVFLHTAPAGARVTAVEMDPTSARIAAILHTPAGHEARCASLERFATTDGRLYDAVIGNAPFGARGETLRDDKRDLAKAETYFLDTALDKLCDGGLVAMIVPTGFMSSSGERSNRERILRKGEFLGAFRLPNTAFSDSHTDVTSDIVLFRKRPQEAAGALGVLSQDQLKALGIWDAEFLGGTYFEGRGAANVMGTVGTAMRSFGEIMAVLGSMQGVPEALAEWHPSDPAAPTPSVPDILASLADDPDTARRARSAALEPPYQVAKPGEVRSIDGVRYVLQGDPPRWVRAEAETPAAITDALPIGELLDDLHEGRARDPAHIRLQAIEALDAYVAAHGLPHRNKPLRAWLTQPYLPAVEGVEPEDHRAYVADATRRVARLLGAVNEDGTYSDLVTGREHVADLAGLDTVATKLSLEAGGFTVPQLAAAAGVHPDTVLDHMHASPGYAVEADGRTWTTMDEYLSGEMWPKYDAAVAAAGSADLSAELRAKYSRQAMALEEAIDPRCLEDVPDITITAGFIRPDDLTAFFADMEADFKAEHPNYSWSPGAPVVSFDGALYHFRGAGSSNHDAALAEKMLNRSGVRKDDASAVERLNAKFREWVVGSDRRAAVEDRYNRNYRGFRQRGFSNTPIAIPGMVTDGLKDFQYGGARWALASGKGIIAADVGLGKTVRGLMVAKLAKVTGQAKKPTFVVPKSVLANWIAEAEKWFPGSRVHVIGETYSKDKAGNLVSRADDEATRKKKYHQLQQNDYDFVFISQPAWNELDVDPVTKGQYAGDDFWAKRGEKLGNAGDKRLNQLRTAHDQALAAREFQHREDTVYFNQLGIDMLLMDEGHAYKNLYSAKSRFGENPKFLGGSGLSNRAQDTFFKTRALREANGGKGVYMLTATPTKNSPLEVYSMLSHIAPEAFERMGIKNSEDFLDRFCVFENQNILGTNGQITQAVCTVGFKNLDELREVMRRYIDRTTAADVGLVLPARDDRQHLVDMTPEQEAEYVVLRAMASEKAGKGDDTGESHIFSIMDKMGKVALDLSLVDPDYQGRSPKIDLCVKNAIAGARDGGQVIFCEPVDLHEKIAAALVEAGIPRERIGIINGQAAASSAARQRISDAFNAGKLDVVIGNKTMEEGVNLQKRTTDMHHLDIPWEPATVQQRNGRGLRQGNTKGQVRIHTYLARGSFDGYKWQTVQAKRDWQDLLWNGGDRVENLMREGGLSRQEMLIMLAANPDEAREKYAADKAAAEERQAAEGRGRANEVFVRFQDMTRTLRELDAKGSKGASMDRLRERVARLRTGLGDDKWFAHKDLLDSDAPAIIEPNTGYAWTAGKAFELAPGHGGPAYYSASEPSRWVVTAVDPVGGTITARPWGEPAGKATDMKAAKFASGVTPIAHDAEAEAAHIADKAVAELDASTSLKDLAGVPPVVLEARADKLQAQLKAAIAGFKDHQWSGPYGLVAKDGGAPLAVPNYGVREHLGTHDLILPTPAGREKAIEGYVDTAMRRTISTRLIQHGRRGYSNPKANGIEAAYPAGTKSHMAQKTNPWGEILRELFDGGAVGGAAVGDANAALARHVETAIAAAPTFRDAVKAAAARVLVPGHGGTLGHGAWPADVVRQLYAKAKALGVLDSSMRDAAPATGTYHADLHPDLYKVPGTHPEKGSSVHLTGGEPVRVFLQHLTPPGTPLEPAPEAKAA